MPNAKVITITAGVPTAPTGTVSSLDAIFDATNGPAAIKAASIAPLATDPALVVAISPNGQNPNDWQIAANAAPVLPATTTVAAVNNPGGLATSARSANAIIGGILTLAGLLDKVRFAGILESITVRFKGTVVTGNVTVMLFKASPSNGTYADNTAGTWNALDMANHIGTYVLATPVSPYTMTTYNLDGIGKAILGTTQSLFAVVICAGTFTLASATDFTLEVAVLPG